MTPDKQLFWSAVIGIILSVGFILLFMEESVSRFILDHCLEVNFLLVRR
jgi:hypothetical protein